MKSRPEGSSGSTCRTPAESSATRLPPKRDLSVTPLRETSSLAGPSRVRTSSSFCPSSTAVLRFSRSSGISRTLLGCVHGHAARRIEHRQRQAPHTIGRGLGSGHARGQGIHGAQSHSQRARGCMHGFGAFHATHSSLASVAPSRTTSPFLSSSRHSPKIQQPTSSAVSTYLIDGGRWWQMVADDGRRWQLVASPEGRLRTCKARGRGRSIHTSPRSTRCAPTRFRHLARRSPGASRS